MATIVFAAVVTVLVGVSIWALKRAKKMEWRAEHNLGLYELSLEKRNRLARMYARVVKERDDFKAKLAKRRQVNSKRKAKS